MAEGNPHADRSSLAAPLEAVTRLVLRSPGLVLGGSVMLAVLAVLISVNGLSFKTSRLDLLNPRSEYNQRWLAYLGEFGRRDDAVCVVRSDDPAALTAAIDDLAAELSRQPDLFESILFRRDLSALKRKGLHFIPDAELAQIEQQVRHGVALIPRAGQPADPAAALAQLNDRLAHVGTANPQIRQALEDEYQRIAGMTLAAVAGGGNQSVGIQPASALVSADGSVGAAAARLPSHGSARLLETRASPSQASPSQASAERLLKEFEPQYLLADKGRLGFVLLKLKVDESSFTRGSLAIRQLRQTIAKVRPRHPAAWIGLTGMPIIEYDEMQASQTDMIWTSLVSMIAVFGLFIAGYGGLRHSLLANLVLLLATAYSFGFVTLAVGHLNILSAAFSAVLIGLGIDFGIHYLACYLKLRGEGYDEEAALIRTTLEVGPGMFTGGVTTAAAFFMAAMTDFVGVRELGLVAGGSILLCVAATVVVLPPLVLVVDRQWPIGAVPQIVPAGRWFAFTGRWPRLVMGASLLVTVAIAVGVGWLRYDHNLLNLQPKHLESADIERELFAKLDDSVWFAVTLYDSREDLLAKKALFENLPTVSKTEEIASLLPASTPERQQLITATGQHLATLPSQEPEPVRIDPHRLKSEVVRAQALLARESPVATPTIALVQQLGGALSQMPDDFLAARLTNTQADLAQQSFAQLAVLRELADPTPPQLADLPRELADRFVGAHHKLLLKVYAHGNVWDMDKLEAFVRDVESVDPRVTGHPVQTYYASRHMQQSYIYTGLYALVAVLVLLWIDLRSISHSLLAMAPLAMGFVQMCGVFGWCGIPLNPANMIVLPVILGIGVDHGVHLVHAWRQQQGRFRVGDSMAVAVLLTATTTTASFGILILARHQGLQSLGQVLTIGVTTCLFSSIVFFPAVLGWMTRRERDEPMASVAQARLTSSRSRETSEFGITTRVDRNSHEFRYGAEAKAAVAIAPPVAEDPPAKPIEDAAASLAAATGGRVHRPQRAVQPEPASEAAPAIPRRRTLVERTDSGHDEAPSPPHGGASPLQHLAVRESDR